MTMGSIDSMKAGDAPRGDAERWFVRMLRDDCPASTRRALERWCAADPTHANAYRQVEELWALGAEVARANPEVSAATARAASQRKPHRPPWRWQWALPAAAVVAVVVVAAAWILRPWYETTGAEPVQSRYVTTTGQLSRVTLADGSTVVLDTDSAMAVTYTPRARRIDLIHGRAQFYDVGNASEPPFVVHARRNTILATGTRFQVALHQQHTEVTLISGRVTVKAHTEGGRFSSVTLNPDQDVAISDSGKIGRVEKADLQAAEGWPSGKLVVDGWPLPRLLDVMNRYSAMKVVIGDPELDRTRIGGVFHLGDQRALLSDLQNGWGIGAERVSPTKVVLHAR